MTATRTRIEYRVTALGLNPRYFDGPDARYQAYRYANARPHLLPTTWWRHLHGNSASPWHDLANLDPKDHPTS